jgi:SAM-dependent methyltransferase
MENNFLHKLLSFYNNDKLGISELESLGFVKLKQSDIIQINASLELISKFNFKNIKKIIDIGSGPGHHAFIFQSLGKEVACMDFVKNQYGIQTFLPSDKINETFDMIWSHHTLEHIPDPISTLCLWNGLLKKKGKLVITVPQINTTMSTGHINSFNLPLLIYYLGCAGFSTMDKCYIKRDSHLKAVAEKKFSLSVPITDLKKLALMDLFSASIKKSILLTGRFDISSLHPNWFGQKYVPKKNILHALDFLENSYFEKS